MHADCNIVACFIKTDYSVSLKIIHESQDFEKLDCIKLRYIDIHDEFSQEFKSEMKKISKHIDKIIEDKEYSE
ncbi:MAG: hypothetical protein LBF71_01870 [Campylobacteraceae bacterium]|jgi:hypothetical protein|nr:hypothetical protein [Campylobacteraceae bacterium]